ncbi:DEAD/DEAH box helicase [Rubrivivax sp. A210]|uniref:DEAD/DEAH box helicase n=1 Tax=Rubrivivax sp. A210 TaxID=2772301 RepID=UPI00191A0F88|nr:DEAD/DEAH box helicase [Rubrivivax sp. A210]CAD5366574.1 DEAD/DEAH box helicase [Rubrivivax sp. A210]
MWVCLASQARQVFEGLQRQAPRWPAFAMDEVRELAAIAWRAPEPDFFACMLDLQVLPLAHGGFAVSSAYDALVVTALKGLGGRFHRHAAAWEVRRSREEIMRALLEVAGVADTFVFVHDGQVVLEDLVSAPKSELPISVPGASPPRGTGQGDGEDMGAGFLSAFGAPMQRLQVDEKALAAAAAACGLRDYQVGGVRHLLGLSGGLLADDMGLGKSRQAVVAGRMAAGAAKVLVVCPASLGINWEREIRAVYPRALIATIGQADASALRAADWIVANYERLGGLVRDASLDIGVMLIDEAHYLKEHQAGRTRNAFLLADRIPRVFLLTGTPVLNREIELHTLLRLSGHPIGRMPLAEFRKLYAGDSARRDELAGRLSEWMLRRGKDVLKDLGDKTQQLRHVQAPDGLAAYKAILADGSLQAMPKITKLRQHLEALKVEFLVESIECLPQDAKALIFCEYMDTVETLKHLLSANGIGCVSLVGSDTPKKRMAAVDAFQQKPDVRVFIGTTMAAGVGITLTAANYVFFASLPWTPALKRQAEDRAYRSGQTRDVLVIVPVVAGTIDEQIFALLDSKREIEVAIIESNRRAVTA